MKFSGKELKAYINEDDSILKYVDETEWIDEGKYSYKNYIFEFEGKNYLISDSRSGSYFSDYSYGSEYWDKEQECQEVQKVTVTKYEWKPVK